MRTTKANPE